MESTSPAQSPGALACDRCLNRDLRLSRIAKSVRLLGLITSIILAVLATGAAVVFAGRGNTNMAVASGTIAGVGVAAGAALRVTTSR